jgi:two-component system phosphate regulon sensor histidine kinase PhoR
MDETLNINAILSKAFPGIQTKEAREIIKAGKIKTYDQGITLCHENSFENTFYIILEGKFLVTKHFNDEKERVLNHLSPGDFFGEMAIIHEAPRAANVISETPVRVLELTKQDFNQLMQSSSSMPLAMVREVSRRLRENDQMAIEDLRVKAWELANAYQQLAEQDYARREFLTTIAHELRTPLMAATGFLQVIRLGILQGEALDSALDTVTKNLEDIMSLTNDILFLQEMDLILPEFQPVDLTGVLMNVIDKQRDYAEEKNIEMTVNFAQGLPDIKADAKSLERAFSALLNNAIKFNRPGGHVRIQIGHNQREVWVAITDEGIGIAPDVLPRIFDRFFHIDQIDDTIYRGAGLGLSIARQVIQQHEGEIQVESKLDRGSTFKVILNI